MVEGMKMVVATVSGYHGSERLKLIRLITAVGANYVGKMSNSVTHLVCWKFKGEKYELAMKFGTMVINHRWFEDCLKEGKRIPEHRYTVISGQDAGLIRSELSGVMEQARPLKENKLLQNKQSVHDSLKYVIDLDSDEIENDDFDIDILLDENLFPRPGTSTTGRKKKLSKRKVVKENSQGNRRAKKDNARSNYEADIHTTDTFLGEQLDSFPNRPNKQTRNPDIITRTDLGESSRRSRRLVKKNAKSGTTEVATNDTALQSRLLAFSNAEVTASDLSNDSNEMSKEIEAKISSRHVTSSSTRAMNDVGPHGDNAIQCDYIPDADGRNLHEISSTNENLEGQPEKEGSPGDFTRNQKSVELSCVICWTDFSSTRGVLPCGHRFCFSCIQNWADHMASTRKEATCPLCKTSFASITRVDGAASLDQKTYSQTVPCAESSQDIFFVPEGLAIRPNAQMRFPSTCCKCRNQNPVDLLIYCQICQTSCVHSYCLDPPLFPWNCTSCMHRQFFY